MVSPQRSVVVNTYFYSDRNCTEPQKYLNLHFKKIWIKNPNLLNNIEGFPNTFVQHKTIRVS